MVRHAPSLSGLPSDRLEGWGDGNPEEQRQPPWAFTHQQQREVNNINRMTGIQRHNGVLKRAGFSLIDMLIAMAILAIITSFAYPAYQHYLTGTYLNQAAVDLQICALALERYYSEDFTYVDADSQAVCHLRSPTRGTPRYQINYESLSATGFVIQARPLNGDCGEDQCITLDQTGQQSFN